MNEKQHPLVLVFYLDAEMMRNQEMTQAFADSVNLMIEKRNFNMMAFFLPTNGEERIECINPVMLREPELEKLNKLIDDIKTNFGMDNIDIEDTEIEIDPSEE